jgi:hypothetical protein
MSTPSVTDSGYRRSLACGLLFAAMALSVFQFETAIGAHASAKSWIDPWREATVALGMIKKIKVPDPNGRQIEKPYFHVVGTGVIFGIPGQKSGTPWLVTAKHVFFNPQEKWDPNTLQLRFSWFEQLPVDEYLGVRLNLKEGGRALWISDTDPNVDLAAIPLAIPRSEVLRDTIRPVPVDNFVAPVDIYEGARVYVFGYPGAVGMSFWTRALLRSGAIAWVHPSKPSEEPFLIDAMVYPGNSGGPVFKDPTGMKRDGGFQVGGRLAFLGIVSQGRKQPTRVVAIPSGGTQPKALPPLIGESWMGI